ncbi:MAG: ComF family protein [Desulfosudaceae bacterium]
MEGSRSEPAAPGNNPAGQRSSPSASRRVKSLMTAAGQGLLELVYPSRCCICEADLSRTVLVPSGNSGGLPDFAAALASHLCSACAAAMTPIASPLCLCCGQMFDGRRGEDHLCGECYRRNRHFDSARAAGIYDQSLMTMVQQLKYGRRTELARPLGRVLLAGLRRWYDPAGFDWIVPVPLHLRKQRQRGFNQVYLLLRQWPRQARESGLEIPDGRVNRHLLVRSRPTRSQTRLSRKERRHNVRGAFAARRKADIRGRSILLVDDVYTTGATVEECARVLRAAGAAAVHVLSLARAR